MVHDYIRSELRPLAEIAADHAEDVFRQLQEKARAELAAEGMNPFDASFTRELDLRYSGQGYELRTPLEGLFADRLTAAALHAVRDRFDERHAQIHGHAAKERPVEVVSYRLRVRVAVPKYEPRAQAAPGASRSAADAVKGKRQISLNAATTEATLYERDRLDIGAIVAGPAIVEQFDATTVIPPGWSGRIDGYGNLILAKSVSMDAITIQILRNKVASLVDEMHYHFYRSGYSTIIRESRDFSCVILDRERAPDRGAADVLPRAGLSPSRRPHP